MLRSNKIIHSAEGIVSIIVTMVMIIVITLVVISFSVLANNEDQRAAFRQLSLEAYYAANSGLNNTVSIVETDIKASQPIVNQHRCSTTVYNQYDTLSSSSQDVVYTCVNVDNTPTYAQQSIAQGSYWAFPVEINPNATAAFQSIDFTWTGSATLGSASWSCPSTGYFYPYSQWNGSCPPSAIQIDLIDGSNDTSLAYDQKHYYTIFVTPNQSANQIHNINTTSPGVYGLSVPCQSNGSLPNLTYSCELKLKVHPSGLYYVRVMPIYGNINLNVSAIAGGQPQPLYNIQANIDVTGKAQGVLKRLDATIPLNNLGGVPFALQSNQSICKQIYGVPAGSSYTPYYQAETGCHYSWL